MVTKFGGAEYPDKISMIVSYHLLSIEGLPGFSSEISRLALEERDFPVLYLLRVQVAPPFYLFTLIYPTVKTPVHSPLFGPPPFATSSRTVPRDSATGGLDSAIIRRL